MATETISNDDRAELLNLLTVCDRKILPCGKTRYTCHPVDFNYADNGHYTFLKKSRLDVWWVEENGTPYVHNEEDRLALDQCIKEMAIEYGLLES